jgi:hypothetical protein
VHHTPRARRISTLALTVALGVSAFLGGGTVRANPDAAAAAGVSAAERFAPAGEGFSALFPTRPEKVVREVPYRGAAIIMCNYVLNREGVDYIVTWMGDFPGDMMNQPETQSFFYARLAQNMINSARQGGKGELSVVEQTDIELGGFKGRRIKFDSADFIGEMRAYKVGLRFYTAGVFGPKSASVEREAGRFLDSLMLKKAMAK